MMESSSSSLSSSSVLRIAVTNTMPSGEMGSSHLLRLSSSTSIESLVQHLATDVFAVNDPDNTALAFDNNVFVTEINRHKIRNGDVLKLAPSASKIVDDLFSVLSNHAGSESKERSMRLSALNGLAKMASDDVAVAKVILDKKKLFSTQVIDLLHVDMEKDIILAALNLVNAVGKSSHEVFNHINDSIVLTIAQVLEDNNLSLEAVRTLVQSLLQVVRDAENENLIQIVAENGLKLLSKGSTPYLIQGCILINHLFDISSLPIKRSIREKLCSNDNKSLIKSVHDVVSQGMSSSTERPVILLQRLMVLEYSEQAKNKVEGNEALELIKELRQLAFPSQSGDSRRPSDEYSMLGFSTPLDPTQQLNEHVPPGYLVLHLLHHLLSQENNQIWVEAVVDKTEKWFNVAKMALEVSTVLTSILVLNQKALHPLLFSSNHPIEDAFVCVMEHAYSVWRMSETTVDFNTFTSTFKDALTLVLSSAPSSSLDSRLGSYSQMVELVREEARRRHKSLADNWESKRSVQLLKEHLRAEMFELVIRQRLRFMEQGSIFVDLNSSSMGTSKTNNNSKNGQKVFCKLSRNHKNILYGPVLSNDHNNGQNDSGAWSERNASVSHKLSLADVKHFTSSNNASSTSQRDFKAKNVSGGVGQPKYVLNLTSESGQVLRLSAPNSRCFDLWCDGIHALMQQDMQSQRAQEDLEMLLNIEIKVRLLELEGQDLPNDPPPIPPLPNDFDFV